MKRMLMILAAAAFAASPLAAQWQGMPVWNNPKGGTGISFYGDLGLPNSDGGKGTAFGARATLGLANLSVTAGVSSWKPDGFNESSTSVGGVAQFRVIGGSLIPVALNLQLGAGTASAAGALPKVTNILAGAGLSVSVPTPGISIEPYVSISNRWHNAEGSGPGLDVESNIGWVLGANLSLGMLGLHVAYDSENYGGGTTVGVIGIGAHVALKAPIGM